MQEVTPREKSLAAANHVASIFFPLLGPVTFFALFRGKSRFVELHALTAIFEQLILKVLLFIGGAISLGLTIYRIAQHINENGTSLSGEVVWPILIRMGITWGILGLIAVYLTITSVVQAVQAYHGKWPSRGFSATLAARVSKETA